MMKTKTCGILYALSSRHGTKRDPAMPHAPLLLRTPEEIRRQIALWREEGHRIGFVPTMGALHAGHAALVERAREECGKVAVSIFVNPAQFAANEDFSRYPRTVDQDVDLLSRHGCALVYLPDAHSVYPPGFATAVRVRGLSDVLCGAHRPGHFDGVATVVTLLLNTVRPDASFFGEKDYQQLCVLRRLAADLRLPGVIHGVPTVREADGLARSSRNRYLSTEQRRVAPALYRALCRIREEVERRPAAEALEEAEHNLIRAGFDSIDYCEIRHEETLELLTEHLSGGRIFLAARLGVTRLIDNLAV
jgi:pantoate--beta-alanine ligase